MKSRKYVYEFINGRKVTKREFIHWFEKKFLYTNRKFNMMRNGNVIAYLPADDFRSVVLEHLLKKFEAKGGIELIRIEKGRKPKKKFKLATTITSDITSLKLIAGLAKNKVAKELDMLAPVEKHVIKPLYLFLNKEVKLYADLFGLKYKKSSFEVNSKFLDFIRGMEKKHPELKYSIVQSYLELSK